MTTEAIPERRERALVTCLGLEQWHPVALIQHRAHPYTGRTVCGLEMYRMAPADPYGERWCRRCYPIGAAP